jgi:hypothetical protein
LWIVAPASGGRSGVGVGPMPVASGGGAVVEGTWW